MAYLEADKVAAIRKQLNATFTRKENWKLSIARSNYSGVRVVILESPIDFTGVRINEFHYKTSDSLTEEQKAVIGIIEKVITKHAGENYNRNAGDLSADYPDWNYFWDVSVGTWDKEFIYKPLMEEAA